MNLTDENISKIWSYIDQKKPYTDKVKLKRLENLRKVLEPNSLPLGWENMEPKEQNHELRRILSRPLKESQGNQKLSIAQWIIRDWGGIKTIKPAAIQEKMLVQLADFSENSIDKFLSRDKSTERISSWSKILAFADSKNHAVYDSRTSVALNCALSHIGKEQYFYMPPGRQKYISAAYKILKQRGSRNEDSYRTYLTLLSRVVRIGKEPTMLDAEMTLFANAPEVAKNFSQNTSS